MNTWCEFKPATVFFAITFTSQHPWMQDLFIRNHSRIKRFTRFRTTAFPTRFDTVIPSREQWDSPGIKTAIKKWSWNFLPVLDSLRNSDRSRIFCVFFKPKLFNTHPFNLDLLWINVFSFRDFLFKEHKLIRKVQMAVASPSLLKLKFYRRNIDQICWFLPIKYSYPNLIRNNALNH